MAEATEHDENEHISPEAAFSLLGNETRIGIIRALWQADAHQVSFSKLRDHADVADSGQFNYHLGRLVGTFVKRKEGMYELTYAGRRIIGAILDGTYTKRTEIDPFGIGASCFACGSSLEASYEGDRFVVRCQDCEETFLRFAFPPGVLEGRDHDELAETAGYWMRAQLSFTVNGICPNCAGVISHSITTEPEHHDHEVGLEYDCERCKHHATSTVALHLSYHPAVIAFHDDHGIDLGEELWDSYLWSDDEHTTVLSADPWRISLTIMLADEALELVVDEDLNVVERHRT
ncbi:MAG: helix-turn-helix transcriptional regulator [Euryarchaeota archaeon]|nr:helix-turn-helix transcriptional regulator [Euryarchaeota archaeon]